MGGSKKYTQKESRRIWKYRDCANKVRGSRRSAFAAGRKPSVAYLAEQGAIMSLIIASLNGKFDPKVRY